MKKVILVLIALGLVGGGFYFWQKRASLAAAEAGEGERVTVKVGRESFTQSVDCNGRIVSNLDVEIKSRASGEIISLPFDVSDEVKKGDLLVEIDPVDQQRNLQQVEAALAASRARLAQAQSSLAAAEKNLSASSSRAEAAVISARARLEDAQAKARRDQDLLAKKHVSLEEAETSRTTAAEAEANLKTAQAELASLEAQKEQLEVSRQDIRLAEVQIQSDEAALGLSKQRLAETKVTSPIDGVVSKRLVQVGQIISSGISNVGGGTAIMIVSDLSRIFVLASVDESDIGEVRVGQKTKITADAFPGVPFEGVVERIASAGTNVSNVVTFEVKIEVTSPNKSMLKPEMTANVQILVAEAENALAVPARALIRKGMDKYVTRLAAGGKTEEVKVETGVNDGQQVEIKSGLKEGDEVVLVRGEDDSNWRNQQGGRNRRQPPPLFGGPPRPSR